MIGALQGKSSGSYFPRVKGVQTWGGPAGVATEFQVPLPASAPGDLLVCFFASKPWNDSIQCVANAGWTRFGRAYVQYYLEGCVFWKLASGEDSLTVTTAEDSKASSITYAISGANTISGVSVTGDTGNATAPAYTPPAGQRFLFLRTLMQNGDYGVPTAAPAEFSNFLDVRCQTTAGASTTTARAAEQLAGVSDGEWASPSTRYGSWTIAAYRS